MTIQTGAALPPLTLPLVGGGTFTLNAPAPQSFTLLVFYRGLHCKRCPGQLAAFLDLDLAVADFSRYAAGRMNDQLFACGQFTFEAAVDFGDVDAHGAFEYTVLGDLHDTAVH